MVKHDKNGKPVAEYDGQERFFDDIPIVITHTIQRRPRDSV